MPGKMGLTGHGGGRAAGLRSAAPDGWLREIGARGEQVALVGSSSALTFRALDESSARLATGLAQFGLAAGDCIALWLPNTPDWMVAHFAAARAGLTTIPVNTWARAAELEHLLRVANCRAIIIDSAFRGIDFDAMLATARRALASGGESTLRHVIDLSVPGAGAIAWSDLGAAAPIRQDEAVNNGAMITFATSGTTSGPKLAVHSAASLIAHAQAVVKGAAMSPADVVLCALPPCGAYGHGLILASLASGARALLSTAFDPDEIIRQIAVEGVTMLALTEPLLRRLLDHPDAQPESLASLRLVFSAGGTLDEVVRKAEIRFGFRVTNVYGSSEVLALASFWGDESDAPTRSAAGGVLVDPDMRVRTVGPSGETLPVGVSGELQFRGPTLLSEYLGDAAATGRAFTADGWFVSQDIGTVLDDAGTSFHYVARSNDALRLKGFLVNPGEIEATLQAHPQVAIAQVVGIPDPQGEDVAVAFVIPNAGDTPTEAELRAHCRTAMASYKTPAIIRIVETFPTTRSANGDKVVKQELRAMARTYL